MKPNINKLVSIVSQNIIQLEPIIEIGSYQVGGQEHYADMRPFFPGKKYIGCDMRKGKGVDRIENVEKLTFENNSAGTLLILETLEHVWNCHQAVSEVVRVLKPGGLMVASTVFAHPIHDHPYDFWRFTPEALNQLFRELHPRLIGWEGKTGNPHTVFCIGFKKGQQEKKILLEKIADEYKTFFENKPREALRLKLRKWKHEPTEQIRKLVAETEEFEWKIA